MRGKKFFAVTAFILMLSATVFAGYESLFKFEQLSRGMTFYFVAFVLLLAIPLMNKYFKTISFFMIALFLSRGLMRISDEQDPIRTFLSIEPGIAIGLLIAIPLIVISLIGVLMLKTLEKAGGTVPKDEEVAELISQGKRNGKTLEQIREELIENGFSLKKINKAIDYWGKRKNV